MLDWEIDTYKARFEAFGWEAHVVDGHNLEEIDKVFEKVSSRGEKPKVILAKTKKGKGVSFWENKEGWHGKPLPKDKFDAAVGELGDIDMEMRGDIQIPKGIKGIKSIKGIKGFKINSNYKVGEEVATRKAYGETLAQLAENDPRIIALDGETSNSTFSELVKEKTPDQFIEMFIAEQNMAGVALGLSKRGFVPFVSTFAAFWTRAFDQIRMSAYSQGNVKYVGSHAGVSIGEDGPSQMGLEDLALFKSVYGSTVFCPSDAVSTAKLTLEAAKNEGIYYIRTARPATPVIYKETEDFKVGGSKVLKSSKNDKVTVVACGVTVHEALKAYEMLKKEGIEIRVIDAYSIKPIDAKTLLVASQEVGGIMLTVEDHYFDGGLGDSVLNVFANPQVHLRGELSSVPVHPGGVSVYKMAVCKMPMSGKPNELLDFEGISAKGIVAKVREVLA